MHCFAVKSFEETHYLSTESFEENASFCKKNLEEMHFLC